MTRGIGRSSSARPGRARAPADAPIPPWNKGAPRRCPERRARSRRLSALRPRCRPWPRGAPGSSPRARSPTASRRPSAYISITAPVVSEARNVMIAMTATSARPPIESDGTIAVWFDGSGSRGRAAASRDHRASRSAMALNLALNRNRRDRRHPARNDIDATGPREARGAAHRIDPSARRHASRSRSRCRICAIR